MAEIDGSPVIGQEDLPIGAGAIGWDPVKSRRGGGVMAEIRCGLIGYGAWGQHHARAIRQVAGAKLVAVAGRSQQSADKARAEQPGANVYTDYRQMLEREQLDLCSIVLPS